MHNQVYLCLLPSTRPDTFREREMSTRKEEIPHIELAECGNREKEERENKKWTEARDKIHTLSLGETTLRILLVFSVEIFKHKCNILYYKLWP